MINILSILNKLKMSEKLDRFNISSIPSMFSCQ
jgi:hypothetical protein